MFNNSYLTHAHKPQVVAGAGDELVALLPLGLPEVSQEVLARAPRHLPEVFADGARAAVLPAEPRQRQRVLVLGALDLCVRGFGIIDEWREGHAGHDLRQAGTNGTIVYASLRQSKHTHM